MHLTAPSAEAVHEDFHFCNGASLLSSLPPPEIGWGWVRGRTSMQGEKMEDDTTLASRNACADRTIGKVPC